MAAPMTADKFPLKPAKKIRPPPETVIFNDPTIIRSKRFNEARRAKSEQAEEVRETRADTSTPQRLMSLKKAKYDVRRFGISGFDKQRKEEARIQLAIELGAKPQKQKGKNYKLLVADLKAKKQADQERREMERQMGVILPKAKAKKGQRIRGLKCQVGKYVNGFQVIPMKFLSKKQKSQLRSDNLGQPSE